MEEMNLPPSIMTRIAPTPSGYLHIGNALNFILTWWLARKNGGKIFLRIDDSDRTRFRDEYLYDIFESLQWLGIDWDFGPSDPQEFEAKYSQSLKRERYFQKLRSSKDIFACDCSRKEILQASSNGVYPGACRNKNLVFQKGSCSLRLKVEREHPLAKKTGDFVVWRKDGLPAYHLASLVDDQDMGVNVIVRGEDLEDSTLSQLYLEEKTGGGTLKDCKFYHHRLVRGAQGEKLSKSNSTGLEPYHLKSLREKGFTVVDLLERLKEDLYLKGAKPNSLSDLLSLPLNNKIFKE